MTSGRSAGSSCSKGATIIQPDVGAAEAFLEPYDADTGEIYDELGRRLKARVIGEDWPKQIRLRVVDAEPHARSC